MPQILQARKFVPCYKSTFSVINGHLSSRSCRVLRFRMEERPPITANILNKQSRTADKEWSSSLGLGELLTTPPVEMHLVRKHSHGGTCEDFNEPSGSIIGGEFLD